MFDFDKGFYSPPWLRIVIAVICIGWGFVEITTSSSGFEMYYLNVMAGPLRKWRFVPAPNVEWIMERDA